jgi:hypothetical protein
VFPLTTQRVVFLGVLAAVYEREVEVRTIKTALGTVVDDPLNIGVVYKPSTIGEAADVVLSKVGIRRRGLSSDTAIAGAHPDADALADTMPGPAP